jgi:parvulin-like peptidyl-prolyl isomerase
MHRLIQTTIYSLFILFLSGTCAHGGWFPWSEDILLQIDETTYSSDDFNSWWENYKEPEMQPLKSVEPFLEWMLLFKEAERMRLYEDPGYRKKLLTFLKARTLMMLKAEEIDGKINISESDIKKRYQNEYTPLYQLNIIFFDNKENGSQLLERLGTGSLDDQQIEELAIGKDGLRKVDTGWYRRVSVNPGWHKILDNLKLGGLSEPVDWKNGAVILRLQQLKEGDQHDFAAMRKEIRDHLWKKQEQQKTIELLRTLRKQYHVVIDMERLEQLDLGAKSSDYSDDPIVTTDRGTVSENDFMVQVRKVQRSRRQNGFGEDNSTRFKKRVLNGIIDQTLTSWEGLARGYEKKSPFKEVYDFYCQHRMISGLKNRLFLPQAEVTPEEVKAYYQKHIKEYSQPEIVKMIIVEGDEKALNNLWAGVAMGGDFQLLARERLGHAIPVRDVPVDHLHKEVKEVVLKLTKGELSRVFTVDNHRTLVQLVEHKPARPLPLAMVGKQVAQLLREEKMTAVRQNYIAKLKKESSVTVTDEVWQEIKMKMEQVDTDETGK